MRGKGLKRKQEARRLERLERIESANRRLEICEQEIEKRRYYQKKQQKELEEQVSTKTAEVEYRRVHAIEQLYKKTSLTNFW